MKLTLKNIGRLTEAEIEISGITVIGGLNGTGKSTVSRALYAVCSSLCSLEDRIKAEKIAAVSRQLKNLSGSPAAAGLSLNDKFCTKLAEDLCADLSGPEVSAAQVKQQAVKTLSTACGEAAEQFAQAGLAGLWQAIANILRLADGEITKLILESALNAEFLNQCTNIFSKEPGEITLLRGSAELKLVMTGAELKSLKLPRPAFHLSECLYLDDPYLLDELDCTALSSGSNHRSKLRQAVFAPPALRSGLPASLQLNAVQGLLNRVSPGAIVLGEMNRGELEYSLPGTAQRLKFCTLSAGVKTFALLKHLLERGWLSQDGMLILDEPEAHLHPQRQLILAEIIVLLRRELNLTVLINTHSHYFLRALQIYAEKHQCTADCRCYLAAEKDGAAVLSDVTSSEDLIYRSFADALQTLDDEEFELTYEN